MRKIVKHLLQIVLVQSGFLQSVARSCGVTPIVVASVGRCGSTLLSKSISQAVARELRAKSLTFKILKEQWVCSLVHSDSVEIEKSTRRSNKKLVFHTHRLPDSIKVAIPHARFVFLYRNPDEVRDSFWEVWKKSEKKQFGANLIWDLNDCLGCNINPEDYLNTHQQVLQWSTFARHHAVFGISYSHIWERQEELCNFLKLNINLPEKRVRRKQQQTPSDWIKLIVNFE